MFIQTNGRDVNDEESEKGSKHLKIINEYAEKFIIPEYTAFFISTGYRMSAVTEEDYETYISDIVSLLNHEYENYDKIKERTTEILRIKYGLIVTNENPLQLKDEYKWKKSV